MGLIWVSGGLLNGCSHTVEEVGSDRLSPSESEVALSTDVTPESSPSASLPAQNGVGETQAETGQRLSPLDDIEPEAQDLPPGRLPSEIVPATTEAGRQGQIQPGRRNPFASLPTTPLLVQRPHSSPFVASGPSSGASLPTLSLPAPPRTVTPIPLAPQPIATAPTSQPSSEPSQTIAVAPLPESPLSGASLPESSPAESLSSSGTISSALEFSGVVQVGDQINIIVQEPGRTSSRYIQVGDRVANGQFVVKAVDFSRGPTPAVILDQAGTETIYWVGSPAIVESGI
ncbi:MAG: hypothetical protein F6K09_08380 [Merismopedia sp. SIO2A8]|nr:hypothetical protein [Merismopedia sp. SIO2A8]